MKHFLFAFIAFASFNDTLIAQFNRDSIFQFRQRYKNDFLTDNRSPLTAADTAFLRFYDPEATFCIMAAFTATPQRDTFQIPTHSGKFKTFKEYGTLSFNLKGKKLLLHMYQNITLIRKDSATRDELFLPFKDETNYRETFGGGRYLDFNIRDIKNGQLILDFNKCYNPYCAFKDGYSCPIPPKENNLPVAIRAGERLFGRDAEK